MITRRQASLYLDDASIVEGLRYRFNPAQAALIPAHITLCREDEVSDWPALEDRIRALVPIALTLEFGLPVRDGNLVYIPPTLVGQRHFGTKSFGLLGKSAGTR